MKIEDAIRFHHRGEPFDETNFLDKLRMIHNFISDHYMEIPGKVQAKCAERFTNAVADSSTA